MQSLVRELRFRVTVEVDVDGLDVLNPFTPPTTTKLDKQLAHEHLQVREVDGFRPRGLTTRFLPAEAPSRTMIEGGPERTTIPTST